MFDWSVVQQYGEALSYTIVVVFAILLLLKLFGKLRFPKIRKSVIILALFFIAFFIRLPMVLWNEVSWDEHYYISAGIQYMEGKFLVNLEHPPLIKYLLGLYLKIIHPSAQQDYWNVTITDYKMLVLSRLFTAVFGALTVIPLYFLAEMLMGENAGIIAALFFALNPMHARLSGLTYLDAPMIFLGVSSTYVTLIFAKNPSWKNMLLTGLCNGLLLASRWIMPILFIIPAAIFILIYARKKKTLMLYVLSLCVSASILVILWIPQLYLLNFNFYKMINQINNHWKPELSNPERDFLTQVLYNMTPIELALYIFCHLINVASLILRKEKILFPTLSTTIVGTMIFLEKRKALHYLVPITPFLALTLIQMLYNKLWEK